MLLGFKEILWTFTPKVQNKQKNEEDISFVNSVQFEATNVQFSKVSIWNLKSLDIAPLSLEFEIGILKFKLIPYLFGLLKTNQKEREKYGG